MGRLRAFVALALVLLVAGTVGLFAAPAAEAYASPPITPPTIPGAVSEADKAKYPAAIIADLLGEVAPATRASETTSYAINHWQQYGGITGNLLEGLDIVQHVPGFQLGIKGGGWIDQALGIDPDPSPHYVPYSDVPPAASNNWDTQTLPVQWWNGNTNTATDVIPVAVGFADGHAPVYGQDWGGAPTDFGQFVATGSADYRSVWGSENIALEENCVRDDGSFSGWLDSPVGWRVQQDNYSNGFVVVWNGQPAQTMCGPNAANYFDRRPDSRLAKVRLLAQGDSSHGFANTSATYTLPGSPGAPTGGGGPSARPLRQWSMTSTCGDGSTHQELSTSFHEDDSSFPGWPTPYSCEQLQSWKLELVTAGTLEVVKTVESWQAPQSLEDLNTAHPECLGSTSKCVVTLWKNTAVTGDSPTWSDCFTLNDGCSAWKTEPPATYRCTYGPGGAFDQADVIDLSGCEMYRPTFDPKQRAKGVLYSDPAADPSDPTETDNAPIPVALTPDQPDSSCFPSGWGLLNPVEWVLKPVECALQWAFVPSTSALQNFTTTVKTAYDASPIGAWVNAITGVGSFPAPTGSGCGGIHLHIPDLGPLTNSSIDADIFSTCDQPWTTIAFITKSFLIMMITWGAAVGVFRNIASAFGYVPAFGQRV